MSLPALNCCPNTTANSPGIDQAREPLDQAPPVSGEHGSAPCSPTLCRNRPPAHGRLIGRADGGPFLRCPLDSVVKERHSALPRLRPPRDGERALCPRPSLLGLRSAALQSPAAAPDSIPASRRKLLTVRNRPGHDGMALARPSEASAAPESRRSSQPSALTVRNPAGQAVMTF